ncbi:hypothetical protein B0T11DRAFT_53256 [Plectosphaerella cucumerina]|uniref:Uncharacterized protein n=1 Tax=Plectosphaerella cucumerina TaxID=40658 RepID=A0A8K0TJ61_9PEZI|nr:hypothetical protein B0T11DRAFT_53256 [Plectosphaerella cucumerina]
MIRAAGLYLVRMAWWLASDCKGRGVSTLGWRGGGGGKIASVRPVHERLLNSSGQQMGRETLEGGCSGIDLRVFRATLPRSLCQLHFK